ncbi:MAG: transporter [Phycisphaerae bacterium]
MGQPKYAVSLVSSARTAVGSVWLFLAGLAIENVRVSAQTPDKLASAWAVDTDAESWADQEPPIPSRPCTNFFGLGAEPIDEPLVTDRPDFTESTQAVPFGRFQLEAGYTLTYDRQDDDRLRNHTFPEVLLRVGISPDVELRFGWSGYSLTQLNFQERTDAGRSVGREQWETGANDVDLGLKIKLCDQQDARPALAMLGALTLPTGSANVSPGDVEPALGLLWAYDLNDTFALAGQVILALPTDRGDRFFQTASSLSLGISLTDRLGCYVEYFGFYPNTEDSGAAQTFNGGFTYLIDNNFQVDIRAGMGLDEEADDFFTGLGFAWRF